MISFDHINKCFISAGKYGGKVIGDYVRNVIVPRSTNVVDPSCHVNFKDITLWFISEQQLGNFIIEMNSDNYSLRQNGRHGIKQTLSDTVIHKRYDLHHSCIFVRSITMIICSSYPCVDFDVNQLVYIFDDQGLPTPKSLGNDSVDILINNIRNKTATILPEYWEKLIDPNTPHDYIISNVRKIKENYIHRGWEIVSNNKFPDNFSERCL